MAGTWRGGCLKQKDREGVWHSWIPAAESGIAFQGDFCLTGKTKVLRRKRGGFLLPLISSSAKKGEGLRYTRKKLVVPIHVKIREGRGKPAGEKSMRAQALKEWNMMDV